MGFTATVQRVREWARSDLNQMEDQTGSPLQAPSGAFWSPQTSTFVVGGAVTEVVAAVTNGSTVAFVSGVSSLSKGLSLDPPVVPDLELDDATLGVLGQNGLG